VPFGAVFAAASNVGEDIGIALLGPEHSKRPGAVGLAGEIPRSLGGAEAAISVDQGWNGTARALPPHQEIGNLRSVLRRRETLLDGPGRGVEPGGKALDHGGPAAALHRIEGRRAQHPFDGREGEVGLAADSEQVDTAVRRQGDRARGPAAVLLRRQGEQFARDVVERLDPEDVVGRRNLLDRLPGGGRHHQLRLGMAARQDVAKRISDQGAGAEAAERALQFGDQLVADHVLDLGVGGHGHRHQAAARGQQMALVGPEGLAAVDENPAPGRALDRQRVGGDVAGFALEEGTRRSERGTALPQLQDAPVAGGGERSFAVIGADQQSVAIDPVDGGLGFGNDEAAVDEAAAAEIELAHHVRVRAAGADRDEAAAIIGGEAIGAVPDPALALRLAERVDVDHGAPLRFAGAIGGERRDPPQAARVSRVAPEVGDLVAEDLVGGGDLLLVVENGEGASAVAFELRIGGELSLGRGIPLPDLGQCPFALHLLEPEIRVVARGRGGGDEEQGGGGKEEAMQGRSPDWVADGLARGFRSCQQRLASRRVKGPGVLHSLGPQPPLGRRSIAGEIPRRSLRPGDSSSSANQVAPPPRKRGRRTI
jgi:hypothetical protein